MHVVDWKLTKPIMERRRRARINAALAELKALIADTIRQEVNTELYYLL